MKKAIRAISILLILAMLLSTAALAVDNPEWGVEGGLVIKDLKVEDGYTLEVLDMYGEDEYDVIKGKDGKYGPVEPGFKLTFTYSDPNQELIYLYKGETVTESSLYYLDQSGSGSFILWPKTMDEGSYTIKRSNNSGVTAATVATFTVSSSKPEYTLGDVDGDESVTANDALWALQAAAVKRNLTDMQKLAADVDHDDSVTANDALWILQAAAQKRVLE